MLRTTSLGCICLSLERDCAYGVFYRKIEVYPVWRPSKTRRRPASVQTELGAAVRMYASPGHSLPVYLYLSLYAPLVCAHLDLRVCKGEQFLLSQRSDMVVCIKQSSKCNKRWWFRVAPGPPAIPQF